MFWGILRGCFLYFIERVPSIGGCTAAYEEAGSLLGGHLGFILHLPRRSEVCVFFFGGQRSVDSAPLRAAVAAPRAQSAAPCLRPAPIPLLLTPAAPPLRPPAASRSLAPSRPS